jgi:RNA polymerase sigma factor (sigma-70 family)
MPDESLQALLRQVRQVAGSSAHGAASDAELLERFLAVRDEAAFELIVRRHEQMVWGVCRRLLRNYHDAEDVFQATFLILPHKGWSVTRRASLAAWLYQVAYRTAVRARANASQRADHEQRRPVLAETRADDPALALECQDLRAVLDRAIAALPQEQRAAVVLCYLEGKTYAEAAQELDWPKGTLSIRLTRAREALRRHLTDRRVSLSEGFLPFALTEQGAGAAPVRLTVQAVARGAVAPGSPHWHKGY